MNVNPSEPLYFHGTSEEAAESIQRDGIKAIASRSIYAYVTRDKNLAKAHGLRTCQEGGKFAVISVRIPPENMKDFIKDGRTLFTSQNIPPSWIVKIEIFKKLGTFGGKSRGYNYDSELTEKRTNINPVDIYSIANTVEEKISMEVTSNPIKFKNEEDWEFFEFFDLGESYMSVGGEDFIGKEVFMLVEKINSLIYPSRFLFALSKEEGSIKGIVMPGINYFERMYEAFKFIKDSWPRLLSKTDLFVLTSRRDIASAEHVISFPTESYFICLGLSFDDKLTGEDVIKSGDVLYCVILNSLRSLRDDKINTTRFIELIVHELVHSYQSRNLPSYRLFKDMGKLDVEEGLFKKQENYELEREIHDKRRVEQLASRLEKLAGEKFRG